MDVFLGPVSHSLGFFFSSLLNFLSFFLFHSFHLFFITSLFFDIPPWFPFRGLTFIPLWNEHFMLMGGGRFGVFRVAGQQFGKVEKFLDKGLGVWVCVHSFITNRLSDLGQHCNFLVLP